MSKPPPRNGGARPVVLVAHKIARPLKPGLLDGLLRRFAKPSDAKAQKPAVIVTYIAADRRGNERRLEPRRRTRLRAGKILDPTNHFIADVAILDRSAGGLRLKLVAEVETPKNFHFFDEESETIFAARLIWRNGALLGARRGAAIAASPRQIVPLRGKFYAMRD